MKYVLLVSLLDRVSHPCIVKGYREQTAEICICLLADRSRVGPEQFSTACMARMILLSQKTATAESGFGNVTPEVMTCVGSYASHTNHTQAACSSKGTQ